MTRKDVSLLPVGTIVYREDCYGDYTLNIKVKFNSWVCLDERGRATVGNYYTDEIIAEIDFIWDVTDDLKVATVSKTWGAATVVTDEPPCCGNFNRHSPDCEYFKHQRATKWWHKN